MDTLIDMNSYQVKKVIKGLLKDRTTGQNIIFATNAYENMQFTTQITESMLYRKEVDIRPRVAKSMEEQSQRTRKNAEVFTPSWICNKMNNHCDAEWFGRENVFNTEQEQKWMTSEGKIVFPDGKSWKDYVLSKRLEITCGEAPYLISRYDAATGEIIPLDKRIGILDRKLRVINENVKSHQSWNQWVYRAFESVYGYEYQGDNLLIARINLLETFCEYTRDRWGEEPSDASLKRIAEIISWNIWQMDGIHGVVPFVGTVNEQEEEKGQHQITLFELLGIPDETEPVEELPDNIDCKIYDWQEKEIITYKSMREG